MTPPKKKCTKCGKFLSATAHACFYCGTLLPDSDNNIQHEDKPIDNPLHQQNVSAASATVSGVNILQKGSTLDNPNSSNKSIMKPIQKQDIQQEINENEEIVSEEEVEPEPILVDTDETDNEKDFELDEYNENVDYEVHKQTDNDYDTFEQDEEETEEFQDNVDNFEDEELDDEDTFNKLINGDKEETPEIETGNSSKSNNVFSSFRKTGDEIKENLKKSIDSQKKTEKKIDNRKTIPKRDSEYVEREKVSSKKPLYDPNSDGYYDNVLAAVDARIEHITKENVIHTAGIVISFIVIVAFMMYFVVL